MNINKYLENAIAAFNNEFKEMGNPCVLSALNFIDGKIPSYGDDKTTGNNKYNNGFYIRLLYTLKYTYAYFLEYIEMYSKLLENEIVWKRKERNVLSIGCGNLIDYYSLRKSIEEKGLKNRQIKYTGVDKVKWWNEWWNKIEEDCSDDVIITKNMDIDDFISEAQQAFDIYTFPKSLSEINKNTLEKFAWRVAFNNNKYSSRDEKKFYILFSIRKNGETGDYYDKDINRMRILIDGIKKKGYNAIERKSSNSIKNRSEDELYKELYNYVTELKSHCPKNNDGCKECNDCNIDRKPMLAFNKHAGFKIYEFKRKQIL